MFFSRRSLAASPEAAGNGVALARPPEGHKSDALPPKASTTATSASSTAAMKSATAKPAAGFDAAEPRASTPPLAASLSSKLAGIFTRSAPSDGSSSRPGSSNLSGAAAEKPAGKAVAPSSSSAGATRAKPADSVVGGPTRLLRSHSTAPQIIIKTFVEREALGFTLVLVSNQFRISSVKPDGMAFGVFLKDDILDSINDRECRFRSQDEIKRWLQERPVTLRVRRLTSALAEAANREIPPFAPTNAMPDKVRVGVRYDAMDRAAIDEGQRFAPHAPTSGWRYKPCEILKLEPVPGNSKGLRIAKVRFLDAELKEAEISTGEGDCEVFPMGLKSPGHVMHHDLRSGDVLDVLDLKLNDWRKAQVVGISAYYIRVQYLDHEPPTSLNTTDALEWVHALQERDRLAEFGERSDEKADKIKQAENESRFKAELEKRGLVVHTVAADGNCLYRSIAFFVYGDPGRHSEVREAVCDYLLENKDRYLAAVEGLLVTGETYEMYVANMRCSGIWGDDPEIRATEECFDRKVEIIRMTEEGHAADVKLHLSGDPAYPREDDEGHPRAVIRLSYHGANHYNALLKVGEPLPPLLDPKTMQPPHANERTIRTFRLAHHPSAESNAMAPSSLKKIEL